MTRLPFVKSLYATCLFLSLAGCAGLPISPSLPASITSEPLMSAVSPPFTVDAAGERLAYVRGGLWIGAVATKAEQRLSETPPVALAWSPDGTRLAAAFTEKNNTRLRLYGTDGTKLSETEVNGAVGDLAWLTSKELLIAVVVKSDYSFGSDFQQLLVRWDGTKQPVSTHVHNATLRPSTSRNLGANFAQSFRLAVSPFADEIAFTRQHDPPEFNTYLRVMLRHLGSGREREVGNIAQDSEAPIYIGTNDQLLIADGRTIKRVNPWLEASTETLPVTGRTIAASPGGTYLLVDGQLLQGNEVLTRFPATVTGQFAAQGSRLFVLHNGTIHLVTGLPADPLLTNDEVRQKLLILRDLRSQGLITPADFQKTKPN